MSARAWAELEAVQVLVGPAFAHDLVHQAALARVRQTAAQQVPEAFRASFLQRNPVNAALLTLAARMPDPHPPSPKGA